MIAEFLDVSTIDFPKRVCSVAFFAKCNFRCPYCHNWRLLTAECKYSIDEVIQKTKKNFLVDSICISGGEPTLHEKELLELIEKAKKEDLGVKVDTNGSRPEVVSKIVDNVDLFAIDFKTSKKKYRSLTSISDAYERLKESLKLVRDKVEVRTTVVPTIVDMEDLNFIASEINKLDIQKLVLQQFRNNDTLDPRFRKIEPYKIDFLYNAKEELEEKYSIFVEIRE